MNKILTILILTFPTLLLGQGNNDNYKAFIYQSNLPDEMYHFYDQASIRSIYAIRTDLNPFYLRGDFDGDNKQDCALSIVDRKTGKKGILIYHSGTRTHYIIGAGKPLSGGKGGDDYRWMDAWKVYSNTEADSGAGETTKVTLKGEGILAIKLESASAMIYWTGKDYRWYQQGD